MKRKKIAGGRNCIKCNIPMQRYQHPDDWHARPGRAYYRWWDLCTQCHRVQNYIEAFVPALPIEQTPGVIVVAKPTVIPPPKPAASQLAPTKAARKDRHNARQEKLEARAARKLARKEQRGKEKRAPSVDTKKAFYASWEWRTLRMKIFAQHGRRCQCCGASPENTQNVKLVVDHIKPLSRYWNLRLVASNLQILCDECNQGKGAWMEADFRPGIEEVQDGNIVWGDSWDDFDKQKPD